MARFGSALVGALALLMMAVAAPGTVSADDCSSVDPSRIQHAIQFRESVHFRSDRDYVCSLYQHPERTTGTSEMGALLTPAEHAEMAIRMSLEDDVSRVERWFNETPERSDAFGGIMIDHPAGGTLVVLIVASASDSIGAEWREHVVRADRLEVRLVERSWAALEALQQAIRDALIAGDPLLAHWVGTALDTRANAVVIEIHHGALDETTRAALMDRFGEGVVVVPGDYSIATLPETSMEPRLDRAGYPLCAYRPCPI